MSHKDTQQIIQRLTVQSFAIKGFSFTFVGLIGNIIKDFDSWLLSLTAVLSVLVFWYLDSYYLRMERIYRQVEEDLDEIKGLDYTKYNISVSILRVACSRTVWPLYFVQLLIILSLSLVVGGLI